MNFTYREYDVKESGEYFSDLQRFIYYYPSNNANYNKQIYKTLDIRDNLILLSYSEAIMVNMIGNNGDKILFKNKLVLLPKLKPLTYCFQPKTDFKQSCWKKY